MTRSLIDTFRADQMITFDHAVHGRYEVTASYLDIVVDEVSDQHTDTIRDLATDMTDGDTDLRDVTSRAALVVILASLQAERDLA